MPQLPQPRPQRRHPAQVQQDAEHGAECQDLDNVVKAALDAIQGIAFHNDNQVHLLTARQWYAARDEEARVEILVEAVGS